MHLILSQTSKTDNFDNIVAKLSILNVYEDPG